MAVDSVNVDYRPGVSVEVFFGVVGGLAVRLQGTIGVVLDAIMARWAGRYARVGFSNEDPAGERGTVVIRQV